MKKFITAILICMLLTTTVFAEQITKTIEVAFNAINIEVNGQKVKADNFLYENTTYVPLRAISELLGNEVTWVQETQTAEIKGDNIKPEYQSSKYPIATITMKDGAQIKVELYPERAPISVKNFISLVDQGFYTDLTFHRIIEGFMIQGGDPNGDGTGGSKDAIKGEFSENGVENNISHTRGTISMARTEVMDSATSQFFIAHEDIVRLDTKYAAFGRVIEGMDVVDRIANTPKDENDKPLTPQIIKGITIKLPKK